MAGVTQDNPVGLSGKNLAPKGHCKPLGAFFMQNKL